MRIKIIRREQLEKRSLLAFEGEELFFYGKAAAEAGELAVAANDAMARHDDRNGIRTVGEPDRAGGFGIAEFASDLAVADRFTVGDLLQAAPHEQLKIGSVQDQWHIEILQIAGKIRFELTDDVLERLLVIIPRWVRRLRTAAVHEVKHAEAIFAAGH